MSKDPIPFVPAAGKRSAALARSLGLKPIPVEKGKRGPTSKEWTEKEYADITFENKNVAVQMGVGGATDIDLDCEEVKPFASIFLPKTTFIWGRSENPASHFLYRTKLSARDDETVIKIVDKEIEKDNVLLEVRIQNCCSAFPESGHPSGDIYKFSPAWDKGPPPEVDGSALVEGARLTALMAFFSRHWAPAGVRNDATLALAGALTRRGVELETAVEAIEALAGVVGDNVKKVRRTVETTYERIEDEEKAVGLPRLIELTGVNPDSVYDILGESVAEVNKGVEDEGLLFLDLSKDGTPRPTFPNAVVAARRSSYNLRFDEFAGLIIYDEGGMAKNNVKELTLSFRLWCHSTFGFDPGRQHALDGLVRAAKWNTFHPVKDYLNALKWDRKKRLKDWFVDHCNVEDTPLNRETGRLVLLAMVRRIFRPGCKWDYVPISEGGEGLRKSSLLNVLTSGNFNDARYVSREPVHKLMKEGGKLIKEALQGKWVLEIAELAGFHASDVEDVKSFITREEDGGRDAFGEMGTYNMNKPRSFVVWGTTNNVGDYLQGSTGNRRFWPHEIQEEIDTDSILEIRDQLFAEAMEEEKADPDLYLPRDLESLAREKQESKRQSDPWEEQIGGFSPPLEGAPFGKIGVIQEERGRWFISTEDLRLTLEIDASHWRPGVAYRCNRAMQTNGWKPLVFNNRRGFARPWPLQKGDKYRANLPGEKGPKKGKAE